MPNSQSISYAKKDNIVFPLIIFHILLGILFGVLPRLSFFYGIGILAFGIYQIIVTRDEGFIAAKFAGYYMGMEAIFRITDGYLTWEFAKYGVILFLSLGLMVRSRRRVPLIFIFLMLLLLPSLIVTEFPDFAEGRKSVLFNLSGPFSLAFAGIYFYKRKVPLNELFELFRYIIYSLIVLVIYLTFFTPALDTINFGTESIHATSGGFGPNQVSSIFGLGMSILLIGLLIKRPILKFWWLDLILLFYFLFRSLVTFSRGGTISILIVLVGLILIILIKGELNKLSSSFLVISVLAVITYLIWNYTNKITENALSLRYQGINQYTGEQEDITSGRLLILQSEIALFQENPILGVGPGMGKYYREKEFGIQAAAHSEFSRLLGEHGMFGVLAIIILVALPIKSFYQSKNGAFAAVTLVWCILAFYTMFHAAMRLALPGFIYGLGLISLYNPVRLKKMSKVRLEKECVASQE